MCLEVGREGVVDARVAGRVLHRFRTPELVRKHAPRQFTVSALVRLQ